MWKSIKVYKSNKTYTINISIVYLARQRDDNYGFWFELNVPKLKEFRRNFDGDRKRVIGDITARVQSALIFGPFKTSATTINKVFIVTAHVLLKTRVKTPNCQCCIITMESFKVTFRLVQ